MIKIITFEKYTQETINFILDWKKFKLYLITIQKCNTKIKSKISNLMFYFFTWLKLK